MLQPWYFAAFSNILLETFVPNFVSLTQPSLQIGHNSDGGIFDFQISGQSLIKENCQNDIELETLTKHKRHCFFPICGQFGAIRKPDSRRIVCKTYIFINSNPLSSKN